MDFSKYPHTRLRRLRLNQSIRNLVQETRLSASQLVYPVFVLDENKTTEAIISMPGQSRLSETDLLKKAEKCLELGVRSMALFPVIYDDKKSVDAKESYNSKGLVPRAITALKARFPELLVISDIALDPYTKSGQDGIIDANGYVLNDETIAILKQQALCHASAGADFVAPSDMMDGRIGVIRQALDANGFANTGIISYAAKYASALYGPFRDAVNSLNSLAKADKKSYQLDPANSLEAIRECKLDVAEGADILMVKPAGSYLDVISAVKTHFQMPVIAYQVSGEYSMIRAAAEKGWIDEKKAMYESLISIKRAGADGIFTYFALEMAKELQTQGL